MKINRQQERKSVYVLTLLPVRLNICAFGRFIVRPHPNPHKGVAGIFDGIAKIEKKFIEKNQKKHLEIRTQC